MHEQTHEQIRGEYVIIVDKDEPIAAEMIHELFDDDVAVFRDVDAAREPLDVCAFWAVERQETLR